MPAADTASTQRQLTKEFVSARSIEDFGLADDSIRTSVSRLSQSLDRKVLVVLTRLVSMILPELSSAVRVPVSSTVTFAEGGAVPNGYEVSSSGGGKICSASTVALLMQVVGWSCGAMRGTLAQLNDTSTAGRCTART